MIMNKNKTDSLKLIGISTKKLIFIFLILFLFGSSTFLIINIQEKSQVS